MELRRFYVEPEDIKDGKITVKGGELIHMTKILRHKVGYKIVVSNNSDGLDYFAELIEIGKDAAVAKIERVEPNAAAGRVKLTLLQALPKGDKSDFIVQKATELGVHSIVFFLSEYTAEHRLNSERLRRIALEACKQCGRAFVPDIEFVASADELDLSRFDLALFMNERERETDFGALKLDASRRDTAAVIVGSEGGFSVREAELFIGKGAQSVSLGRRILRAETASVAALTLIAYLLGELNIGD